MLSSTIRARIKLDNGVATVRVLIKHPMETGSRSDGRGGKVKAHYIENVSCDLNGKPVFTAYCGPGIAKNPYLSFRIPDAMAGDTLQLTWTDNQQAHDSLTQQISD